MIDLATIGLRASTLFSAAREAARVAGRSKTFLVDGSDGLSAVNAAKQKATSMAGYYVQITPSNVRVSIIGSPIRGGATINQTTPLASSSTDYVYQIEVSVTGNVEPLATLSPNLFGNVPGLTGPMTFTARSSEFAEYPTGLTQ